MNAAPELPFRLRAPMTALWRSPGVLQLGLDAGAVVLAPVPTAVAEAIGLLHEPLTVTQLAQRLPTLGRDWAQWLCAHLSTAGLVTIGSPQPASSVAVLGRGPLARALSEAVGRVGIPVQRLERDGLTDAVDHNRLVVVAPPTAEPDRVDLARLRSVGCSHLVVRIEPSRAVVGPFVEPRLSACVHCDDLARAHRDPAWAGMLQQLSRQRVAADPGLLAWAVATATNQIRAWHRGSTPETRNRCMELGLDSFAQHQRVVARHPDCSCAVRLTEHAAMTP